MTQDPMSKLYLSFTGICLFVPRFPLDDAEHQGRNEMRVLLADSREPPPVPHTHGEHERHLPRLICPIEHVLTGPGRRTEDQRIRRNDRTWAVFYLDDQDLFLGSRREALLVEPGGGAGCPTSSDRCSFLWAVSLEQISEPLAHARPECFRRLNPHGSLEARVALTEGWIHTLGMASEDKHPYLFEFTVPEAGQGGPHRQAIADSVLCEINFGSPVLELRTRLIRMAREECVRKIYPPEPGSELTIALRPVDNKVHASVKNMPGPDIDGSRLPVPRPEFDVHFSHVYRMSAGFTGQGANVPHRLERCPGNAIKPCAGSLGFLDKEADLVHRGNPNCPPPSGAAHSVPTDWIFD